MVVLPIVRHMLLCEDFRMDGPNNRRLSILGLVSTIHALDDPPYPLLYRELCVFLSLTGGRGDGEGRVVCLDDDDPDQRVVHETPDRTIHFPDDPLAVVGMAFRLRDIEFPHPGRYTVQFRYADAIFGEQHLRLR